VKEILLGPRAAPTARRAVVQGMATNAQGYYILTPFALAATGEVIFVNRGWIPTRATTWNRPFGRVTFRAVLNEEERKATFSPPNDPHSKKLFWLEYKSLIESANIEVDNPRSVVLLDAIDADDHRHAFPLSKSKEDYVQQSVSPFSHLVYATTW
jgi:surfeit locus 1 family protein